MPQKVPYAAVTVAAPPVYRGGPAQPPATRKFSLNSMTVSWSWGCEPTQATAVYDLSGAPVTSGYLMTIACAGYTFFGCCVSDEAVIGSGGKRRTLTFSDNRYFLDFDQVFCSFNKLNDKIVNGTRVKRYEHILPNDFDGMIKSYTDTPYTAAQILDFIFNSKYVKDRWTCNYHPDQFTTAIFDIDALSGKSLKALLQEITDEQGLVFTLMNGPYNLVWVRKGTNDVRFPGAIQTTTPPGDSDNRSVGTSLSGHPTHIIVLGDRNLYQVHEIPLVQDWSTGWDQFYDIILFRDDIYQRATTTQDITIGGKTFKAGTGFKAIGADKVDPEQIIARQLALVRSLQITVGEYAALRQEKLFIDAPKFADYRKFCGKSRLDMPAALYIEQLVLRSFRFPDNFALTNQDGLSIPLDSLEIAGKMIARVTHDPVTGSMTWNTNQAADGNGYAIIQGYNVGRDMFRTINPDRFDLSQWNAAQTTWEHIEFQVDDSGELGGKMILFNEPIISSANLVKIIDGYGVFNAAPKKKDGTPGFDLPKIKIAVCFAAEKFWYESGNGNRDYVQTVGGLNTELACRYVVSNDAITFTGFEEKLYADGLNSVQKAQRLAAPLLNLQFVYAKGGRTRPLTPNAKGVFPMGTVINPFLDRISVEMAPAGCKETVEYACEKPRQNYVPERDLDRNTKLLTLFPGQAQLRHQMLLSKIFTSALQTNPAARKTVSVAFRGLFGSAEGLVTTHL